MVDICLCDWLCICVISSAAHVGDTLVQCAVSVWRGLLVWMLQIGPLATLCYNCGVGTFQKRQFEEATLWLKESFDIGKLENAVCAKDQACSVLLI